MGDMLGEMPSLSQFRNVKGPMKIGWLIDEFSPMVDVKS